MNKNSSTNEAKDAQQGALLVSIPRAGEITGLGRTKIYGLIGDGALTARKCGRRVLVEMASIRAFVASMPAASIRPQAGAKRRQVGA